MLPPGSPPGRNAILTIRTFTSAHRGRSRSARAGRLMELFCADLDRQAAAGYLETDRPENVAFYAKFRFDVIGSSEVLGVTNYYMRRPPVDQSRSRS
jgi:hypothetical protein